ncbi:ECF subfamily RNA polymerase sigma factor, BldN family [Streptomyces oceani]|uniref:RNA polymerase subunit sigma-24 n=1 Tax=Streptomyces oceani TaxID=1075402 RepID=A0A1E7KHP3_9ACTN|nr:ECF subfamily RNA polymerase sigma factor, BldN family [Streptomyces oceani]OEV03396.1 RNA polymerase subunit sigma-24 [Streptomyces oceani]
MYPYVGVDTSGPATLRTTVIDQLRAFVPRAYAVPALATATPVPVHPCFTLADSTTASVVSPRAAERRPRAARSTTTAAPGGAAAPARSDSPAESTESAGHAGADTRTARRRPTASEGDTRRMMELVERAQNGEPAAFGGLYDQYSDTVYRYVYYRVGSRATAEDLTSETFLRALRRISTFTWQGRDFGAWLVTIARNLVADHFKSSRFRLEVTTGEMLDANEVERSPEDSVLETLSNAALLDSVRRLNPQQQECVTLRFLQGLTVAETARVMGKNEGAIKTLQYRAVRTLARLLPDNVR